MDGCCCGDDYRPEETITEPLSVAIDIPMEPEGWSFVAMATTSWYSKVTPEMFHYLTSLYLESSDGVVCKDFEDFDSLFGNNNFEYDCV